MTGNETRNPVGTLAEFHGLPRGASTRAAPVVTRSC